MAFIYVLISQRDSNRYIGSTINLGRRIAEHNSGQVKSTKRRRPLRLFAYQEFDSISEARIAEHQYKNSRGRYERALSAGRLKVIGA